MSELFAKLFVRTERDLSSLISTVAEIVSGRVEPFGGVQAGNFELDVGANEYRELTSEDDFMRFPYAIDVFVLSASVSEAEFVEFLSRAMRALHERRMQVVAACDWEESLPGRGKLM